MPDGDACLSKDIIITEITESAMNLFDTSPQAVKDFQTKLYMILNDVEMSKKCTDIAIYGKDRNTNIMNRFLMAKHVEGLTERTLGYYRISITRMFAAIGKDYDEITTDQLRYYFGVREIRDHVSKVTIDNERRNLSAFYTWARRERIITDNPIERIPRVKCRRQKKKAFSGMEIEMIRNACRDERDKAFIEVLISTWCRVGEIVLMKISEIKEDSIIVHGKGEKDRIVYFNARAKLAINQYLEKRTDHNDYLFPRGMFVNGRSKIFQSFKGKKRKELHGWWTQKDLVDPEGHIDISSMECIVRDIGKKAGVTDCHPHRFRRTGATNALKVGMPLITVSKMLGHQSVGTTQIYLDIDDTEIKQAHQKYVS